MTGQARCTPGWLGGTGLLGVTGLDRLLIDWLGTLGLGSLPCLPTCLWLGSLVATLARHLRGESETLADAHLLLVRGRGGLLSLLRVLELGVEVGIDA